MSFLLQPLKAGKLSLANRLVMPPIATSKAEADGSVSQAILDYYHEKSAGGHIGLIVIEHSYIHLTGKAGNNQLSVSKDSDVAGLTKLAALIHANGSRAVMQINHAGSAATEEVTGSLPLGPSAVANPRKGGVPQELNRKEIAEIIRAFADAARRVKTAGFDAVEIHSAHGYLLSQFFSPLSNKRTDEYGGDVQNRIRLHLEVIAAVRQTVGPDFPIMLRLGVCDFIEGGITIEDSKTAAAAFAQAGVCILDISGSFNGFLIPGGSNEPGYFAPLTAAIKEAVTIPVILTGGITDGAEAERLLSEGKADLIGVGRAIFQDSNWAKHAVESLLQHQSS